MTLKVPALSAAVLALCGVPAHAIVGGTPTTSFAAVGRGVQVAPDWVLSTVHSSYSVGDTYVNGYGQRVVAARYDAPGSSGSGDFPANDLSLIRLLPVATSAPYLLIEGQARGDSSFSPLAATIVSAANAGPARGYGFTTISESTVMLDPDDSGPMAPVTVNYVLSIDSQTHVQDGDSSGGLFAGHAMDSSVLLGITSALLTDANNVPTGSAFVQPAAYRSWIDSTMAADAADSQMLLWTTAAAVPEPATWALWGLGLALLAARQSSRGARRA